MSDIPRIVQLASATALALALGQAAWAEQTPVAPAAAPAPAAAAPATAASPPTDAPRDQAAARRAEMDAERNKRYADLRARAAEVGMELPETPPWESSMQQTPTPPAMPDYQRPSAAEWETMRVEREAMREKLKNMTPKEREAMREEHWKKMRERAAARGIEMPETPPWKEAEARYRAVNEQYEKYKEIVDAMTEEQQEAARALLGGGPGQRCGRRMPPMGGGYGPQGGYPGYYGPYPGGTGPMQPPMPDYEGYNEPQTTPVPAQGKAN
jgi:hypothetical protein